MRQIWLTLTVALVGIMLASVVDAQRFPQLMNLNTHEGKFDTGGFGFGFGGSLMGSSSFRRESLSIKTIDGEPVGVYKKRNAQNQARTVFGADIDFQLGSNNDTVGADIGIEIYSMNVYTTALRSFDNDAFEAISESVTLMYLGFDLTVELYESEFVETDGRRTRENWGLSFIVGPKAGLLSGSFSDLNGLASIGIDFGLMADFPIGLGEAEDLLSVSPFIFGEINWRLDIDGGLAAGDLDVVNDNFDLAFYDNTGDVNGDGVSDFPGIAVRRHNFIPAYQLNFGADINLTPIFTSRSGSLINNWRFHAGAIISVPISLSLFATNYVGDGLWGRAATPAAITFNVGAAYFF